MKKFAFVALLAVVTLPMFAQETEPDPAVQAAKEETAVVYDLGRFFGYVWRMQQEEPKLALSDDQMTELYQVSTEILNTSRIEPDWAEDTLDYLELDLLSPAQLMQVDMYAIEREETRVTGTGTGGGTGSGPILTYINGGAFNPIVDDTKTIGQDFVALYEFMKDKLGR